MANFTSAPQPRERIRQFADLVLRLGHRQPVTGRDDHARCGFQNRRGLFGGGRAHRALFRLVGLRLHLPERAEQHVGERPVHGLAHDDRKDQPRRAVEGAGHDQQVIVQREPHGAGRKAGVGIQDGDHGGHIGAADGDDQQHAEQQRQAGKDRKQPGVGGHQDQPHGEPGGDQEQHEVDGVLVAVGDGTLRQHLLQFAHGHKAAREGQEAQQGLDDQGHHDEAAQLGRGATELHGFVMVALIIETLLGFLTFTGSLMAMGKLQEVLPSGPSPTATRT